MSIVQMPNKQYLCPVFNSQHPKEKEIYINTVVVWKLLVLIISYSMTLLGGVALLEWVRPWRECDIVPVGFEVSRAQDTTQWASWLLVAFKM